MKLSDEQVAQVREEFQKPKEQQRIAKELAWELGTSATTIYRIRRHDRRRKLVCPCIRCVKYGQLQSHTKDSGMGRI